MSYNPTRAAGGRNNRKDRKLDPHAGVKHSDIMRRKGVGLHASSSERIDTLHGFTTIDFSCESFVQRFACIYAGNNTGIGYTDDGDRVVRVQAGILFVTFLNKVKETFDDGDEEIRDVQEIKQFQAGHTVCLPKGTRYSLASSGTANVELLITETANYQDGWKELEAATVNTPESIMFVPPRVAAAQRRPRIESKAYQQAQQRRAGKKQVAAAAETRRRSSNENVNSSTVVGVNPRPSGPPTDD